jgi:hypothetical protein
MKNVFHKAAVEAAKRAGYTQYRISRNSHYIYRKKGSADLVIPSKLNDLNLCKRILKMCDL